MPGDERRGAAHTDAITRTDQGRAELKVPRMLWAISLAHSRDSKGHYPYAR